MIEEKINCVGLLANLNPCARCHGTMHLKHLTPHRTRPVLEELAAGGFRVTCYGCQITTFTFATKQEAINGWNGVNLIQTNADAEASRRFSRSPR